MKHGMGIFYAKIFDSRLSPIIIIIVIVAAIIIIVIVIVAWLDV